MIRTTAFLMAVWPMALSAQSLNFPSNATLQQEVTASDDTVAVAVGPWVDGAMQTQDFTGTVSQQAWHLRAPGLTTVQLLRPLRAQLAQAGFDEVFTCETESCGGFDFRFGQNVMPPPAMQVDLGDFRYVIAVKEQEAIALLVSRSALTGFIQLTRIGPAQDVVAEASAPAIGKIDAPTLGFEETLESRGRAVLDGLTFETGSARLSAGPFASLQSLADYLAANTNRTVALVGHTDSAGSLDGNIALSKRRAGAVLERLVTEYAVPRRQLDAQGMGYLAPIANNASQEGRDANRRVEVIITSTQ